MKVQNIQQVPLQAPLVDGRFGTADTQKGVNHCFAVFFQHRLQQPDELVAVAFFAGISDSFKGFQRLVDGTFFSYELGPRNVETIDQIVKSVSEQDHDDIFETTQTR